MCNPTDGYIKSGYDFLFQEHTYFWHKGLCKYVLLSTLFDMPEAEYESYHTDPNYAQMFTDGGSGSGDLIEIYNGINSVGNNGSDYYNQMVGLLTPSRPQSKKKNALIIILIIAAVCLAGYGIYRFKIKK